MSVRRCGPWQLEAFRRRPLALETMWAEPPAMVRDTDALARIESPVHGSDKSDRVAILDLHDRLLITTLHTQESRAGQVYRRLSCGLVDCRLFLAAARTDEVQSVEVEGAGRRVLLRDLTGPSQVKRGLFLDPIEHIEPGFGGNPEVRRREPRQMRYRESVALDGRQGVDDVILQPDEGHRIGPQVIEHPTHLADRPH